MPLWGGSLELGLCSVSCSQARNTYTCVASKACTTRPTLEHDDAAYKRAETRTAVPEAPGKSAPVICITSGVIESQPTYIPDLSLVQVLVPSDRRQN